MTVCVAVKVRDCIVFAADSAVTMMGVTSSGEPVVHNIWNHGIKVYNLYKGLPIVAMSAGAGNLGDISVGELVKYMRAEFMGGDIDIDWHGYDIETVANRAARYLADFVTEETLEFFVGGYGSEAPHGEVWHFSFSDGELAGPGLAFGGTTDTYILWGGAGGQALSRLVLGIDPNPPQLLADKGLTEEAIADLHRTRYMLRWSMRPCRYRMLSTLPTSWWMSPRDTVRSRQGPTWWVVKQTSPL